MKEFLQIIKVLNSKDYNQNQRKNKKDLDKNL